MDTDASVCRGRRNKRRANIGVAAMKLVSLVPINSSPDPSMIPDQLVRAGAVRAVVRQWQARTALLPLNTVR
jgi:hypothetical protein